MCTEYVPLGFLVSCSRLRVILHCLILSISQTVDTYLKLKGAYLGKDHEFSRLPDFKKPFSFSYSLVQL
jgi:hypothetical protein